MLNWNGKLSKEKELQILKALDRVEQEAEKGPSWEQLIQMYRDFVLGMYPAEISALCKYPNCNAECAFKDNTHLCPVLNLVFYMQRVK